MPKGINASFGCQYGLDMLVIAAPPSSAAPHVDIYRTYARATGMPSPLPENAALYLLRGTSLTNDTMESALYQRIYADVLIFYSEQVLAVEGCL